jgi:hypothetical protein
MLYDEAQSMNQKMRFLAKAYAVNFSEKHYGLERPMKNSEVKDAKTFLKYSEYHIQKSRRRLKGVAYWKQEIAQAEVKISKAAAWLDQYKLTEGELVKTMGDERKVSIDDVEKSLLARDVKRVRI